MQLIAQFVCLVKSLVVKTSDVADVALAMYCTMSFYSFPIVYHDSWSHDSSQSPVNYVLI